MAGNIGNLAIVISGNARPFKQTMQNVKNEINQFSTQIGTQNIFKGGSGGAGTFGIQFGSLGRLIRSSLVAGFGGGLAGALVGVGAMAFGEFLQAALSTVSEIGHKLGEFLADSLQEGMKFSRMELGVNFLAGNKGRGAEWIKELRSLSASSGYKMEELGSGLRLIAGNTDDLDNAIPRLRAIAKIGAAIGLDAENVRMFALAIGQVTAAGRFEAQELNQLTEHGLPIKELAKTAGMGVGEFRAAVKAGSVDVDVLDKTLNRLALAPTGRYFNILAERAGTALGQIDKLTSSWNLFKAATGVGLMQGLVDTGWIDALQNGLGWIAAHQGEIKQALTSILDATKSLSISGSFYVGALADAWVKYYEYTLKPILTGMLLASAMGAEIQASLASAIGANQTAAMFKKMADDATAMWAKLSNFGFDMNRDRTTEWGKATGGLFAKSFKQAVQAEKLIEIFSLPKLSPAAAKFQEDLRKSISEGKTGGSPFSEFQNSMKMIGEIKDFEQFRPLREAQMQQRREGIGDGGFGGLGGLFNIVANQAKVGGELDAAMFQAYSSLEGHFLKAFDNFPKALERGSVESFSAITHALYGSSQMNVQERIAAVMDLAKKAAEETAANTKETVAALKALGVVGVKP